MRTWIKQLSGTRICGQVAVAVIAGITVEEATKVVGKKGYTRTKDLVQAVRKLGFECPDRCVKMPKEFQYPKLAIAKLKTENKKHFHWVVIEGFNIFDGINGNSSGSVMWNDDWKISSYLPITDRTCNGCAF